MCFLKKICETAYTAKGKTSEIANKISPKCKGTNQTTEVTAKSKKELKDELKEEQNPRKHRHSIKATALLREWMNRNHKYPYPDRNEKNLLAEATGLTSQQIRNWFLSARKTKWCETLVNEIIENKQPTNNDD